MNNEEKWKQEFEKSDHVRTHWYWKFLNKTFSGNYSDPETDILWQGYLQACKQRQSEIERLEKAYAEAMEILNSEELLRQQMNSVGYRELDKLKEELKKKDQIIEKAVNLLRLNIHAISPSDVMGAEKRTKEFLKTIGKSDDI